MYHPQRGITARAGEGQEDAMSIIRLIHITIDPSETETAARIWKTGCATLMISQIVGSSPSWERMNELAAKRLRALKDPQPPPDSP